MPKIILCEISKNVLNFIKFKYFKHVKNLPLNFMNIFLFSELFLVTSSIDIENLGYMSKNYKYFFSFSTMFLTTS